MLNVLKKEKLEPEQKKNAEPGLPIIDKNLLTSFSRELDALKDLIDQKEYELNALRRKGVEINEKLTEAEHRLDELELQSLMPHPMATSQQVEAARKELDAIKIEAKRNAAHILQLEQSKELPNLTQKHTDLQKTYLKKITSHFQEVALAAMRYQKSLADKLLEAEPFLTHHKNRSREFGVVVEIHSLLDGRNNLLQQQHSYNQMFFVFDGIVKGAEARSAQKLQLEAETED